MKLLLLDKKHSREEQYDHILVLKKMLWPWTAVWRLDLEGGWVRKEVGKLLQ